MIFTQYLLLLLVLLAGPLFGLLLAYIAPEELKPAQTYIPWILKGIMFLVIILNFYFLKFDAFTIMFALIFTALVIFKHNYQSVAYYLLGFVVYAALPQQKFFIATVSASFIFGILSSVYYCSIYEKDEKIIKTFKLLLFEILLNYSGIIIVGLIPYFLLR